jgi:sugar phosphate isomerase/epimerase
MPVYITTSAFGAQNIALHGQQHFIPLIAEAGAAGIEIRRELFSDEPFAAISQLSQSLEQHSLQVVYSAPVDIWLQDGQLNRSALTYIIYEGILLRAQYVKVSLGSYKMNDSDLDQLTSLLQELQIDKHHMQLTVENDQTEMGGKLERMQQFLSDCQASGIPVKMTFDIGNWLWNGEHPLEAARALASYVIYIHCKQVELASIPYKTVPLSIEPDADWRELLSLLPQHIPRAIEFPIVGDNVLEAARKYVKLLS